MDYTDGDTDSLRTSIRSISPAPSTVSTVVDEPPPYSAVIAETRAPPWSNVDHRTSSTHSIPPVSDGTHQRRLLLIYIHGFMGDETSFQSFPAHLHNLVKVLLSETHELHTKVYPRFRSKRALQIATEDFSKWLRPHEHPDTDIILIGHSMGGLLASEVALLPSTSPTSPSPFRHRILGTINFDTPFCGLHPGVISSGLSSLFRPGQSPAASPHDVAQIRGSQAPEYFPPDALAASTPQDPNFNPIFDNDVRLPVRRGWQSALHFVSKHSQNLGAATNQFMKSYAEFGSCLADYDGLKLRFCRIRMLEDEDANRRRTVVAHSTWAPRVRFVNFYTVSPGRPKQAKEYHQKMQSQREGAMPTVDSERDVTPLALSPTVLSPSELETITPTTVSIPAAVENEASDTESLSSISSLSSLDSLEVPSTTSEPSSHSTSESIPSTTTSVTTFEPPESLGPPPHPNSFPTRREYVLAVKAHSREIALFSRKFQAYQKLLKRQSKLDADRTKYQRKVELEGAKAALRNRPDNADVSTIVPSLDTCVIKHTLKNQRKHDVDILKDEFKLKFEEDKARKKAASEAQKEARKAMKEGLKARVEVLKQVWKEEQTRKRKEAKAKAKRAKTLPPSSPMVPAATTQATRETPLEQSTFDNAAEEKHAVAAHALYLAQAQSQDHPMSPSESRRAASIPFVSSGRTRVPSSTAPSTEPLNPPKERKFCKLPTKDSSGQTDPTWQRVYMEGVDEVGAHCGLFFPQSSTMALKGVAADQDWCDRYASLVNDVAGRIEQWIHDDMTDRLITGVQAL
ncbi:MAG: hypothetical protein M1828_005002 [Chrysothrix sp. TS-e1954]|nr:MAG: hypothetical protein M1828_005002 [Chrysothrix sp. TS-e1954]